MTVVHSCFCNNTEGKITVYWLVNEESIFFLILLREEGKIVLAHEWSSGGLATSYSIEQLFFCTMASRFEIVDEEYIEQLKYKSENENKNNSTEWWKNAFKKWANERNLQGNFEEYEKDVLDQRLSQFQAFRNSVILLSMLLTSNSNGASYTCVFKSCWNYPRCCATRAISSTSENTRDINP